MTSWKGKKDSTKKSKIEAFLKPGKHAGSGCVCSVSLSHHKLNCFRASMSLISLALGLAITRTEPLLVKSLIELCSALMMQFL